mmetsp:Transcript_50300/g.83491  ORF Transcript_50300/g.83491 Transcript_50300/m.83491 type:complete len:365 (-) Transcript_50300:32-1126(-)
MRSGWLTLSLLVVLVVCVGVTLAEDYYTTLGVPRDATTKQIRKAYRDLSLKWHPDKNKGDETAAAKYSEINNAYEVLTDEEKRRVYDQYGEEGLKQQRAPQQHGDFFNFFNFGGQGGGGADSMQRGADINLPLYVSLEDIYLGKTMKVAHRKQILCTKCRGTGAEKPDDVKTCTNCAGKGIKVETRQVGPGFVQHVQTTCNVCNGKGHVVKSKCNHCHGHKIEIGEEQLTIIIEKGMPEQHQIRFHQESDEAPDTTPGDLSFTVVSKAHDRFVRKENDLYAKMKITLVEALTGFERSIPHLDGHSVVLSRIDITIPGFVQRIKGEGLPVHNFPSQRGDLFVEYTVIFPKFLNPEQRKAINKILE